MPLLPFLRFVSPFLVVSLLQAAPPDDYAFTTGETVYIPALDNDGPSASLSIVAVGQPRHGEATAVSGSIRYTPDPGFYGKDFFSYTGDAGDSSFNAGVQVDVVYQASDCWVPFNECGEDVVFEAGGRILGFLDSAGEAPQRVEGRFGYGLRFDGIDDRLVLSGLPDVLLPSGSDTRTVMAWLRVPPATAPAPAKRTIFDYGTAEAGGRFRLCLDVSSHQSIGQKLRLEVVGGHVVGTARLDDGHWHHITVLCDDLNRDGVLDVSEAQFFVDGQSDPLAMIDAHVIETSSGSTASVGAGYEPAGSHFAGDLDELRIFPAALSPDEIDQLMDGGQPEAEAWHRRHFGPAPVDWTSDSDNDELDRLAEYAFGSDPRCADAGEVAPGMAVDYARNRLAVSFTRRPVGSHNLFYVVEVSNDLQNWEALTGLIVNRTVLSLSACLEEVVLSGASPISVAPRIFSRAGVRFRP